MKKIAIAVFFIWTICPVFLWAVPVEESDSRQAEPAAIPGEALLDVGGGMAKGRLDQFERRLGDLERDIRSLNEKVRSLDDNIDDIKRRHLR